MPKEKNTNKKKGNTFLEKAKQIVTQIFSDNPGKAYTIKQIAKKAQIKKKEDL